MNILVKYLFFIAAILFLSACQSSQSTDEEVSEPSTTEGDISQPKIDLSSFPETYQFPMQTLEGETFDPASLKGKVVFVNLWATWCPPCVEEMPDIHELYKSLDPDKYAFVMLSMDQNPQKAVDFINQRGFSFPTYTLTGDLQAVYETDAIPTTFVLSPNGEVKFTYKGMKNYNTEDFKGYLASLH